MAKHIIGGSMEEQIKAPVLKEPQDNLFLRTYETKKRKRARTPKPGRTCHACFGKNTNFPTLSICKKCRIKFKTFNPLPRGVSWNSDDDMEQDD